MVRLLSIIVALLALAGGVAFTRALLADDAPTGASPQASRRSAAADEIARLEQAVRERPQDPAVATRLAGLYLQRARETGDPAFYALAQTAVDRARSITPDDASALVAAGAVANGRHDFAAALAYGEQARALNPELVAACGVVVDALVELGRYEEALVAAQEMLDRRPDFASLSRASYLRQLHGDIAGAIAAMEQAARAGTGIAADEAWAWTIIGDLHLIDGDLESAAVAYDRAELALPGDAMVLAGRARLAVARGDGAEAERLLRAALDARPLAEYAIALGELLESQGRAVEAEEQYEFVRAQQRLFAATGVDTDLELALFDADHGDDPQAAYARARVAYERRPSILAADALAWAAHRAGDVAEARRRIEEALRLGTRDPRLAYHASVIFQAAGDREASARHRADATAMLAAQPSTYRAEIERSVVTDELATDN